MDTDSPARSMPTRSISARRMAMSPWLINRAAPRTVTGHHHVRDGAEAVPIPLGTKMGVNVNGGHMFPAVFGGPRLLPGRDG